MHERSFSPPSFQQVVFWKARKIAIIAVAFLVAAVTLQLYDVYRAAVEDAERLASVAAESMGQSVSNGLRGINTLLEEAGSRVLRNQHHSTEFSQWIKGALLPYPEIRYIAIVTPDGRMLPGTWPNIDISKEGLDVSDRAYFKRAKELTRGNSKIVYGQPVIGRATGERSIHVAAPIWNNDGTLMAIMVAAINPNSYDVLMQGLLKNGISSVGIYSSDGRIIARSPDFLTAFGKDISSSDLFKIDVAKMPSGVVRLYSVTDGIRKFLAYRYHQDLSLIVAAGITEEAVFSRWGRMAVGETILLFIIAALLFRLASITDLRQMALLDHQRQLEQSVQERTAHLAQATTTAKQMQENFHLFSLAVEQSPSAIIITDRNERIEYINAAFTSMTGTSQENAIGKRPAEVLKSGKTPSGTYATLRQQIQKGRPWKGKFINRKADNSEYISFATIWPVRDEADQITHYLGIQDDITAQVRAGEELDRYRHHLEEMVAQRTAELAAAKKVAEDAAQAKTIFLANMSHEIRTPLNAIFGFTGLLRRAAHDPEQADKLEKIHLSSIHLLGIINAILDLSKIESGKVSLLCEDFDIERLITGVLVQVSPQAETKGLILQTHIEPNLPALLHGDAMRLSQALLNFVNNAVKFTEKGTITVRVRKIEANESGILIQFEVADSGIGIAADDLERLFSPFEQADSSTTRKYGGTGLGLAITRKLAELMGGEVGASSRPGFGSQFWFTAKLAPAIAEALPADSQQPDHMGHLAKFRDKVRLLLAEDVPLNRHVMADLLAEIGLTADMAEDGLQAVSMATQTHYDLILMDMQMPNMDGLDATIAIRRLPGHAETPIVALTANAFDDDRRRCLDAGMNDHLAKPVDPEGLHKMLVKWLKSEAPAVIKQSSIPTDEEVLLRLHHCLDNIADIDLERGLKQIRKPDRLLHYLLQYADTCDTHLQNLRERLSTAATNDAILIAHSLKGASAMMAATGIQIIAGDLEKAISDGTNPQEIQNLMAELERRAPALCKVIRKLA